MARVRHGKELGTPNPLVASTVCRLMAGLARPLDWLRRGRLGLQRIVVAAMPSGRSWRHQIRRLDLHVDIDPLTALPNRRAFFERAKVVFNRPPTVGSRALLMIGFGDPKQNDGGHGHDAEEVLVRVADAIRRAVERVSSPAAAVVGRIGGNEFAAILTYIDSNNVLVTADQLSAELRQPDLIWNGKSLNATLGVGIVFCLHQTTIEAALIEAGAAMRRAKEDGRGGWRSATQGGRRDATRRVKRLPARHKGEASSAG